MLFNYTGDILYMPSAIYFYMTVSSLTTMRPALILLPAEFCRKVIWRS